MIIPLLKVSEIKYCHWEQLQAIVNLKIIFYGIIKAYIFLKNKFGSFVKAEHIF